MSKLARLKLTKLIRCRICARFRSRCLHVTRFDECNWLREVGSSIMLHTEMCAFCLWVDSVQLQLPLCGSDFQKCADKATSVQKPGYHFTDLVELSLSQFGEGYLCAFLLCFALVPSRYIVYSIGQILVEWQVEVLRGLSSIHQLNPGKPELTQFQLHSQRCFRGQHLKSKAKVDGLLPRVSASGQQVVAHTKVTQIDRSSKSFAGRGLILGLWRPWRSLSPPFTSHIYNPKNINPDGFWMGSGSLF